MGFGINKKYFSFILNPYLAYVFYKRKMILKKYKKNHLIVGLYSTINDSIIGSYNYFGNNVRINYSKIGDHSYVNSNSSINRCNIGKFCSIASNVTLGLGEHPINLISTHPAFYSNNKGFKTYSDQTIYKEYSEINIGNDVWISNNVIIMGGVNIDDGAIIAAGAIVTKDVKPYEIVGGVPARHIKFRFDEGKIEKIIESTWWNKDEKWFELNYKLFLDEEKFFDYLGSEEQKQNT